MNQGLFATKLSYLLVVLAIVLPVGQAGAGTVTVTRAKCAAEVTVRADDAQLSEVFQALAAELGFALLFDRSSDRSVSVDQTRAPEKVIEFLTRDNNVMVTTADDTDCVGQKRITQVRFLAAGDPIFFPAHEPATAQPMPVATIRKSRAQKLRLKDQDYKRRNEMTPEERKLDRQRRRQEKGR